MSRRRGWRLGLKFRDEPQYLLDHMPLDSDLANLEGDIEIVAQDLNASIDRSWPIATSASRGRKAFFA